MCPVISTSWTVRQSPPMRTAKLSFCQLVHSQPFGCDSACPSTYFACVLAPGTGVEILKPCVSVGVFCNFCKTRSQCVRFKYALPSSVLSRLKAVQSSHNTSRLCVSGHWLGLGESDEFRKQCLGLGLVDQLRFKSVDNCQLSSVKKLSQTVCVYR